MPQPQPDRYVFIYHRLTVVELLLCCLEKKKKKKRKEKKRKKEKRKKGGGRGAYPENSQSFCIVILT